MTETDGSRPTDDPAAEPVPEPAEPEMTGPMNTIQGVDSAALGIDAPTNPAPEGVDVDDTERHVPGPDFGARPATDSKAWFTTLAADSEQAGMGTEPGRQADEEDD